MLSRLLSQLKKITPQEELILNSDLPILSHFTKKPCSTVVDKDIVIGKNHLISLLIQPRFIPFPEHSHNFLDIIYMYHGSTCHTINKKTVLTLQTDDILFLKPGVSHSIEAASHNDICVHFQILPEFLQMPVSMLSADTILRRYLTGAMAQTETPIEYLHYHLQDLPEAKNLLENMLLTLTETKHNTQQILQATMGTLFLELANRTYTITLGSPSNYEQEIVTNALLYIDNNYADATLQEYCSQVNRPAYYVSRLMKKYSPYTFTTYLQRKRLLQAANLLITTQIPIEEIIRTVGYDNSSYFYKIFRDTYHTTPKQYRHDHFQN